MTTQTSLSPLETTWTLRRLTAITFRVHTHRSTHAIFSPLITNPYLSTFIAVGPNVACHTRKTPSCRGVAKTVQTECRTPPVTRSRIVSPFTIYDQEYKNYNKIQQQSLWNSKHIVASSESVKTVYTHASIHCIYVNVELLLALFM